MFAELSAELAKQLTALEAVAAGELAAFNKLLTARRLDPIPTGEVPTA